MPSVSPLRVFGLRGEENLKPKIASTIKEIEYHRKELENIRARVEQRRKALFDTALRAMKTKDQSKASVYANEWAELRKVGKVVYASELALTQVVLRLESIAEVGDVMSHMSTAFKVLRKVNKTVQGIAPSLDHASDEINSALSETMAGMGKVSPDIQLNIQTADGEELIEQARRLAEERADEMKRTLMVSPIVIKREAPELQERTPLLAAGDDEEEESQILGALYSPRPRPDEAEERVLQYAAIHNGNVDITDASSVLKMPSDEVEQAMLTLMAQGKVKLGEGGSES
ncbi:MAG: Snf7 family protein [Nitrososphaerota archaeon]|nr:Snf7 family protein [Nitrososphaerota archaeon]MDG6955281.1 Snf7 family protein [Nitrososphaerota archaeon]